MRRVFGLFAISAVTISSLVGMAGSPARADTPPMCEQVWVGGDWFLPESFGRCLNWGGGTLCHEQYANADPEMQVEFYVCVPAPVYTP
jgi:hypothetical protein